MGDIADMMIEAQENGGYVEGDNGDKIHMDGQTGEVFGIEEKKPKVNWQQRDRLRMDKYVNKLKKQGFRVQRITDYHIRVNEVLDVWHGRQGTSSQVKGKDIRYSKSRSQGVISVVHRHFKYDPLLKTQKWQNLTFISNGETMKICENGEQVFEYPLVIIVPRLSLLKRLLYKVVVTNSVNLWKKGKTISDVIFWGAELSNKEVESMYSISKPSNE